MSRTTYEVLEILYALKRQKYIIYGVGLVFLISFVVFYLLIYFDIANLQNFGKVMLSKFSESVSASNIDTKSSLDIFLFIFMHNLSIAFLNYILTIFSIFIMVANAFLIAYVFYVSEPLRFILLVLPHGIIEIPAFILSVSSGVLLFKAIIKKITGKNDDYIVCYKDSLRIFSVSIILFIIAAAIESTVTFEIAKLIH